MIEKVITESFLRTSFLKEIPENFYLREDQILTPAGAQFLSDRKIKVVTGEAAANDGVAVQRYIAVADGTTYMEKPEHLTQLTGNQLIPKDHPLIVFRGWLDRLQAEILLLQKQVVPCGAIPLRETLGELLDRTRAILRAEVVDEPLVSCVFLGMSETEIRERSHHPQKYFGLQHLEISAEMDTTVLALNRLRTLVRGAELSAVAAFSAKGGIERSDIIQALNRMSSVIYVLMLQVAQQADTSGDGMDNPVVDEIVAKVMAQFTDVKGDIPVELSARHVHLSPAAVQKLFGKELTPVRELSQPGQYLCQERVRLVGPAGTLENIAVLGPARGATQVEISATDARILGLSPPIRQSGDIQGSTGLKIVTDIDTLTIDEGLIVAARHLHMHQDDAVRLGVKDKDLVRVRIGDVRSVVFEKILIRVNENYRLAMHIDFDEGNACGWVPGMTGQLLTDRS
ncbi:Propanediol utilization protein [Desulfuromusa kysingii]|uniref:Phosphate propanoyltransferase n=1 Tax=Desulfuromusa kysingii TaxID=37625 RepID=A0A1H3ZXI8_9BACT|nr:phosphate propanoyltransferase [Desulfuromusa kysingii]SEA28473.1 Propanediol utilization protein [Desulfuromusa kysingii]